MTVEDIFSQIGDHMVEGIMFHSQMADYYRFLGFESYAKCHEHHFKAENKGFRKWSKYYLEHYNKLLVNKASTNPKVIPDAWYKYTRQDVDMKTRLPAIQTGDERWVKWEHDTKMLYQNMYRELVAIGEIAAAGELMCYICDVDAELAEATQKHLEDKAVDFNIADLIH